MSTQRYAVAWSDEALAGFEYVQTLHESATSSIFLAKWLSHAALVVLKCYASDRLTSGQRAAAWQEAQLPVWLQSQGVPNVCQVHWAFQRAGLIVVVQQHCEQGSLARMLITRGSALTEREAACTLSLPLLLSLCHLERCSVLHGDIKPENVFVSRSQVLLGDWGVSQRVVRPLKHIVGTIDFMAPEVLSVPRRSHFASDAACRAALTAFPGFGLAADVWAFGITVYESLCGRRPWPSVDKDGTISDILSFRLREFPPMITPQARAFVRAALTRDPGQRPSPRALLAHPWLQSYVNIVRTLLDRAAQQGGRMDDLVAAVTELAGSKEAAMSMLRSIEGMRALPQHAPPAAIGGGAVPLGVARAGTAMAAPPPRRACLSDSQNALNPPVPVCSAAAATRNAPATSGAGPVATGPHSRGSQLLRVSTSGSTFRPLVPQHAQRALSGQMAGGFVWPASAHAPGLHSPAASAAGVPGHAPVALGDLTPPGPLATQRLASLRRCSAQRVQSSSSLDYPVIDETEPLSGPGLPHVAPPPPPPPPMLQPLGTAAPSPQSPPPPLPGASGEPPLSGPAGLFARLALEPTASHVVLGPSAFQMHPLPGGVASAAAPSADAATAARAAAGPLAARLASGGAPPAASVATGNGPTTADALGDIVSEEPAAGRTASGARPVKHILAGLSRSARVASSDRLGGLATPPLTGGHSAASTPCSAGSGPNTGGPAQTNLRILHEVLSSKLLSAEHGAALPCLTLAASESGGSAVLSAASNAVRGSAAPAPDQPFVAAPGFGAGTGPLFLGQPQMLPVTSAALSSGSAINLERSVWTPGGAAGGGGGGGGSASKGPSLSPPCTAGTMVPGLSCGPAAVPSDPPVSAPPAAWTMGSTCGSPVTLRQPARR